MSLYGETGRIVLPWIGLSSDLRLHPYQWYPIVESREWGVGVHGSKATSPTPSLPQSFVLSDFLFHRETGGRPGM
jgi:hypothetical protein